MTKRNITDNESQYYSLRQELISKADKSRIADSPMLFSDRITVQNMITRYELYKLIKNTPGDIIELGLYKGNSFAWLSQLSVILEPFAINRRLIGFDTFNGFTSIDTSADPSDISELNFSDTDESMLNESLDMLDKLRPVNKIRRFEVVKGDIMNTLPRFLNDNPWMTCALLILDTDLYAPTKLALELVLPLMPKGAVIAFDEYNYQNFPGETQALRDTLGANNLRVKKFDYESCTAYAIIE